MILDSGRLCKDFQLDVDGVNAIRNSGGIHSELCGLREGLYKKTVQTRMERVKNVESNHYRALTMREALKDGTADRKELLDYLGELQGGPCSGRFSGDGLKSRFIEERRERLRAFNEAKEESSQEAALQQEDAEITPSANP
jgi:hypothetical protein